MKVTNKIKTVIQWWIFNLPSSFKLVMRKPSDMFLHTDASLKGWGAYNKSSGVKTGGQWSAEELALHINILEIKACQLALFTFCKDLANLHVRIFMDNTTSCSYINKFWGENI